MKVVVIDLKAVNLIFSFLIDCGAFQPIVTVNKQTKRTKTPKKKSNDKNLMLPRTAESYWYLRRIKSCETSWLQNGESINLTADHDYD